MKMAGEEQPDSAVPCPASYSQVERVIRDKMTNEDPSDTSEDELCERTTLSEYSHEAVAQLGHIALQFHFATPSVQSALPLVDRDDPPAAAVLGVAELVIQTIRIALPMI
jgi:hypothetical protein